MLQWGCHWLDSRFLAGVQHFPPMNRSGVEARRCTLLREQRKLLQALLFIGLLIFFHPQTEDIVDALVNLKQSTHGFRQLIFSFASLETDKLLCEEERKTEMFRQEQAR